MAHSSDLVYEPPTAISNKRTLTWTFHTDSQQIQIPNTLLSVLAPLNKTLLLASFNEVFKAKQTVHYTKICCCINVTNVTVHLPH